jgi:putative ABC transport system permease protein
MLTLALGIGANTAIFSFIDNVLLKPIPYPQPDRIVRVMQKRPKGKPFSTTSLDFLDWQKQNTVFENLAGMANFSATLTTQNQPMQLWGARVSRNYFDIYGAKPFLGRTFLPEEEQYGKDHVVLLTHALWASQFGSDKGIVGRAIRLDDQDYRVVGVLPPGGEYDRSYYKFVKPLAFVPSELSRDSHWFGAYARLKPGVTLEQARIAMNALAARYAKQYPDTNSGFGVSVEKLSDVLVGPQLRNALYILFAAACMVLLIGCANLANLTLSRGAARSKEVAVRASLGAGRGRLMRQFLTENLLLSVLGGALGIVLGFLAIHWLNAAMPAMTLPPEANVQMDGRVTLFALAISVFTGLLFGLAPTLQVTKPDLTHAMKDSGRATAGGARCKLRNGLIVGELALAFMLLCGAGLLIRSFFSLDSVDPGFNSTNVLTMSVATPRSADHDRLTAYLHNLRLAVKGVPGVEEAAYTTSTPLVGATVNLPVQLAGTEPLPHSHRGLYFVKIVSPDYFRALGIPVRKGRVFDDHDNQGAPLVVVLNERLATRLFPDKNSIGQRLLIPLIVPGNPGLSKDRIWTVIGVIGNERVGALNDETSEGLYEPWDQMPLTNPTLIIHSSIDPRTLRTAIRQAVDTVNKNQPLSDIRTMDEIKVESMVSDRLGVILMATFSGIALLLAAVGIYGVISYAVSQRTNELGIRAALGADRGRIMSLVLSNGLTLTAIGLALGLGGSLALMGALRSQIYGVGVRDPLTMFAVAAILTAVAAMACYIPARRATKTDPAVALRYE